MPRRSPRLLIWCSDSSPTRRGRGRPTGRSAPPPAATGSICRCQARRPAGPGSPARYRRPAPDLEQQARACTQVEPHPRIAQQARRCWPRARKDDARTQSTAACRRCNATGCLGGHRSPHGSARNARAAPPTADGSGSSAVAKCVYTASRAPGSRSPTSPGNVRVQVVEAAAPAGSCRCRSVR